MIRSTFKVCNALNSGERYFHAVWCSVEMKNEEWISILMSNMNLLVACDPTPEITKHVGVLAISLFCSYIRIGCQTVIGFALASLHDWFKYSHQFLIQSEAKPSPIDRDSFSFVFPRFVSFTCNYEF